MPTLKRELLTIISAKSIARLAKSEEKLLTLEYNDTAERYNRILRFPRKDINSDEFIKLIYGMLIAFKMNSRGARLRELPDFKKMIEKHTDSIQSLAKFKLEKVKATDGTFTATIDSPVR